MRSPSPAGTRSSSTRSVAAIAKTPSLKASRRSVLERLVPTIDIVEVFNAREVASSSNVRAFEFARAHDLPGGVGSDAHRRVEIGRAYVDVAPFATPQELLVALREGKVTGTLSGIGIHVRTWIDMGRKLIRTRAARLRGNAP